MDAWDLEDTLMRGMPKEGWDVLGEAMVETVVVHDRK